MSLKRALLYLIALVLAVGTVPAGIVAYSRLAGALEDQVRGSLSMAPELLASRWSGTVDVRMMHARDVARTPGLGEALVGGDHSAAARIVEEAGAGFPEAPVLIAADGAQLLAQDSIPAELLEATRQGEMPVEIVAAPGELRVVSLAPVEVAGEWIGAAGGTSRLDASEAQVLAGLTRSEVVLLDPDWNLAGGSGPDESAAVLADALRGERAAMDLSDPRIAEIVIGGTPYLILAAPLGGGSRAVFLKDLDRELAVLPLLRRVALWSAGITLLVAFILGSVFAGRLARPVGSLAGAAGRLASGDFEAPLESSGILEVKQVSESFDQMRSALRARLEELEAANEELEDRQNRLVILQGELVQRDRLASAGRLLSQLAHEIRNPIASIRNCLEVLRRRAGEDSEAREFADMAIDELLRMHELSEQMLDVYRPRDPEGSSCDVAGVAKEVATLLRAGAEPEKTLNVSVVSQDSPTAGISPDSLKQVLLNLGLNAQEAMAGEGPIELVIGTAGEKVRVEVLDRGPGIPEEIMGRIFDPFFTTKAQVHGVGLGLFTSEALVRTYGGRIEAANRVDGPGARFTLTLPPGPTHA